MPERKPPAPRSEIVMLRVSPTERATLAAAAAAAGVPLSTYARRAAMTAAARLTRKAA